MVIYMTVALAISVSMFLAEKNLVKILEPKRF